MSQPPQKSALNIVMGAMTFGEKGMEGARVHDIKDVEAILDVFQAHGHTEVDTARMYCRGTSEKYLGRVNWQERGLKVETKLWPFGSYPQFKKFNGDQEMPTHSPEDLRKFLDISLKALNAEQVEIFYLHGPDRTLPYEITLKAIDELYKEGKFKRFGISNYMSWEVAEIVGICRANGYIQPTVYQGIYNALYRAIEPELFPCLRKFGITFYEYNPLAGGFFTGRYTPETNDVEEGSRFDPNREQGKWYRVRYWQDYYFEALASIQAAASKHNLTMTEVALRWVSHHSLMKRDYGDSILIGASSLKHIEENLNDLEKGPLPEEVVKALDDAWDHVKVHAYRYWL